MRTFISRFEISNYRSCTHTGVELNPNLSVLIGVNGSGKSNFLNGLLLLRRLARDSNMTNEEDFTPSICNVKTTFILDQKPIILDAKIKYTVNEFNIDQVVSSSQEWKFEKTTGISNPLKLSMPRFFELKEYLSPSFWGKKPRGITEEDWQNYITKSFESVFKTNLPVSQNEIKIIEHFFNSTNNFISNISYYSASRFTDPTKCSTYFEIGDENVWRRPSRGGSEHQRFMRDLYFSNKNDNEKFQEFLSIVGNDGVGLIDTIEYQEIEVPTNAYEVGIGGKLIAKETKKILVIPNFIINSIKLSPNQLSEGTFKTLAIVFYLVTDPCQLLILEEPEVCIHHGLLDSILDLIIETSEKKQIIISTHSDYVLDKMDPENVFMVTNDRKNGTKIKHIPYSMSKKEFSALKDYLKESGNLGEYWRQGGLD
jgi:predicted ATP-dependent endonuclease of OLD family